MHVADFAVGVLGANGIVGAGAPHAAGAAWAFRQDGSDRIAVAFFGDGGMNQGVVFETLNLAAIWNLPVLFVCENNGYAVTMPAQRATAGTIVGRVSSFDVAAESVDGMDVEAVVPAVQQAVARARSGAGPSFIECRTYRFVGHHTAERAMKLGYRTDDEIERWRERDPLELTGAKLAAGVRAAIDEEVDALLDEAVDFARRSPRPDPTEALDLVYADGRRARDGVAP
jgi:pyruvate dehydrogenase E1 component alpha subunit